MSYTQVSQWLWTFLIVEITPILITNIKYKSYIVFAVLNFVTIPIVYFTFPEVSAPTISASARFLIWNSQTCGLTLEAVDLLFADRDGKRPSIFRVVRDSRKKEYLAEIEATLRERAEARSEARVEGRVERNELGREEDEKEESGSEKFDVSHIDKV